MDTVYFVEGQCEKALFEESKRTGKIVPGRVVLFNTIQNRLASRISTYKKGSTFVLVFDTDKEKVDVLLANISDLKRISGSKIICLPQVLDFEDEIKRSCLGIKEIKEVTKSKSNKNFKPDFCACKNITARLESSGFSLDKMWRKEIPDSFKVINEYINSNKIYGKY